MKNMQGSPLLKRNGKRHLNVMFADLSYLNRHTVSAQYVPLGIGLIAQYAKKQFGDDIKVSLFKNIDKFLNQATQNPPDVVGLSVYYWNIAKSQYLIKCLREKFGRDIIIVIGGPTFDSDEAEQHMCLTEMFPDADAICINEGEIGFSNVIRKILENRKTAFKDHIEGVSFLDGNNLVQGFVGNRTGLSMDLETMGSPYLSGLLDEFMNSDNQPLVQTSRSCPYSCTFCVAGKNRGKLRGYPIEQIKEELKYVSKKYADKPLHTMYIVDENFGILKRDKDLALKFAENKKKFGYPNRFGVCYTKNSTEKVFEVAKIFDDVGVQRGVSLNMQSMDKETLKNIKRDNIKMEFFKSLQRKYVEAGIATYTEFILPLPGETYESWKRGMNQLLDSSQHSGLLVYNVNVMPNAELGDKNYLKKYKIETVNIPLFQSHSAKSLDESLFIRDS